VSSRQIKVTVQLRLAGARLAILSACETGIPGTTLPDEVTSLPTGLLQAGFAGVAASLWSVEDINNTMLMFRFYDLWCSEKLEPTEALRRTQQWHRDKMNGERKSYFKALLLNQSERDLNKATVDLLYKSVVLANPNDHDFTYPFYGAAFSYVGI